MSYAEILIRSNEFNRRLADWRGEWISAARPNQLEPASEHWDTWLILAGRGYGKTRTGAQTAAYWGLKARGQRIAVIGPTQGDVRSVCFEGKSSGLQDVVPSYFIKSYSSSTLEMELINGSILVGKSAEKPDRLRGPQWHGGWGDEVASWGAAAGGVKNEGKRLTETWDNYQYGLRLGKRPRTILTTTPRPIDFIRNAVKDNTVHVTVRPTFDNEANLAPSAVAKLKRVYGNTRKGQQELYGAILSENDNALWKVLQLEELRISDIPDGVEIVQTAVAVDPAVTKTDESDETGIVVVGLGDNGHCYVLADFSGSYSPAEWAKVVLVAYERFEANCVIAETNQGGDLVEFTLKSFARDKVFYLKKVHAKRGKYLRAEPIAALYEQGLVHHVGGFNKLEQQMVNFAGSTGEDSPDRLDALVYAVGHLALGTDAHAFW